MENLVLVEIETKSVKRKKIENENFDATINASNTGNDKTGEFQTKTQDITKKMAQGKYGLKGKYSIIFLYNSEYDTESKEFITEYGWKIHNLSSANIRILTYYSERMVSNWFNVHFREKIKFDNSIPANMVRNIIRDLKTIYEVEKLPSIVIVKKNSEGNEEYFNVGLSGYNKEGILGIFKEIIEIINDNCEEDFSVISNKICRYNSEIKKSNNMSNISNFYYIRDLINKESNHCEDKYHLYNLAKELDISERTLLNKRTKNTFTRDECFYIGIRFKISSQELNRILRINNQTEIGMAGRDAIIRQGLIYEKTVEEVHEELIWSGFSGIIPVKKQRKVILEED